jgi:predicted phage tail protein
MNPAGIFATILGLIMIVCSIFAFAYLDSITGGNTTGLFILIIVILGIGGGISFIFGIYELVSSGDP